MHNLQIEPFHHIEPSTLHICPIICKAIMGPLALAAVSSWGKSVTVIVFRGTRRARGPMPMTMGPLRGRAELTKQTARRSQ
jgi:hypothetical protein